MRISKYTALIEPLLRKGFFTAGEAGQAGIPPRMLSHFCKQGLIDKHSRGIYRAPDTGLDFDIEDLVITAGSIPRGIVCLISALCYYGLTDQIMREYWIAVPNENKCPKRPQTRIVRMRNTTLGATTVQIGAHEMKLFDKERTVIDSFRYLSDEIAIKALQAYLKSTVPQKPDLAKLTHYATLLRVNITPYITAFTT
jgi:predicted transcriptional regulator of viral defense system